MTDPQEAREQYLARFADRVRWPEPPGRWLIACSGGADSLALVALAAHAGCKVVVGHVDHGLRPGSEHEAAHVAAAVGEFGVVAHTRRVDIASQRANLEARARDARYAALRDLSHELGCVQILTGHTRDDQAETVLLAVLRGAALDGLSGIAPIHGDVARPMLDLTRRETAEICRALQLRPLDDPMNHDRSFRRVWLRREVIPALAAGADRDLVAVLARQAEIARDDRDVLDDLAASVLAAASRSNATLDIETIRAAPPAIGRRVLRRWLGLALDRPTLDSILRVVAGEVVAVEVGGGTQIRRSVGQLVRVSGDPAVDTPAPVRSTVPGSARFGDWELRTRIERCAPVGWPHGCFEVVLDADVVGAEIVIRAPEANDIIRGIDRVSEQTVTAARKARGVRIDDRVTLPIVTASDGAMLWALGYGGDHRARVTARTRRYCWMTVHRVTEAVAQ